MRVKIAFLLLALTVFGEFCVAQTRTSRTTLDIYVLDVEGGNAQLWVTPSGESVVIDTGNGPGAAAVRDADRIMAAIQTADQIDHLIITHFHSDHIGGVSELATRIPIREFIDHGPNVQPNPQMDEILQHYAELYAKANHTYKTGDRLSVGAVDWRIVSVAANVLKTPLPGAPGAGAANPYCASFQRHEVNPVTGAPVAHTEDDQVVSSHVTFGKFRVLYLADFTGTRNPS